MLATGTFVCDTNLSAIAKDTTYTAFSCPMSVDVSSPVRVFQILHVRSQLPVAQLYSTRANPVIHVYVLCTSTKHRNTPMSKHYGVWRTIRSKINIQPVDGIGAQYYYNLFFARALSVGLILQALKCVGTHTNKLVNSTSIIFLSPCNMYNAVIRIIRQNVGQ